MVYSWLWYGCVGWAVVVCVVACVFAICHDRVCFVLWVVVLICLWTVFGGVSEACCVVGLW